MICPGPGGPVKRLPVLRCGYFGAGASAGCAGPTTTGIEKMRDDVALVTQGIDGGRHHEHAFLGGQQHELMRERFFGRDVIYWPEVLAHGHGEAVMTFKMHAYCRELLVRNDRDLHRQRSRDRRGRREREMDADGGRVLAGGHCRNHLSGQRLTLGRLGRRGSARRWRGLLRRGVTATRKRSEQG